MADFPTFVAQTPNTFTTSGTQTLIQIKAGAAALDIVRVEVSFGNSSLPTQLMNRVQVNRYSAAGSSTSTNITPVAYDANSTASLAIGGASATCYAITGEGTVSFTLLESAFHSFNGFMWIPTPEERIRVPQAGIIGVKFPAAIGQTVNCLARVVWLEYI